MNFLKVTKFLQLTVACLLMSGATCFAEDTDLSFDVIRGGDKIGEHHISIQETATGKQVDIKTDVEVKVLFVTAYEFKHVSQEKWENGVLTHLESTSNDDGTHHKLTLDLKNVTLQGIRDGQKIVIDHANIPASLWNKEILSQQTIVNTLDGHPMNIQVTNLGMEEILISGQKQMAEHVRLTGDLERELWFNQNNQLVQVKFKGSDGSEILYRMI